MAKIVSEVAPTVTMLHKTPAPYLPFRTFQTAIEALEHGIPKKIDRTIWRSQSGLVQSQILMALRFLALVDDQDRPTQLLHSLVEEKETRAANYGTILSLSYSDVLAHDLTKMTPKMIEDEMEQYSVTGDTKRKAVTFFLRAAKFAGLPMHPLLSSMVRNTGPRKRKGKGLFVAKMNGAADPAFQSPQAHANTVQLSNGATVTLKISGDPFTLPAEDRQFVFDLVDKLQAYAASHPSDDLEDNDEEEEETP
jgi:antitoxin component of MazEF toxin-antitoxin module